MVLSPAGSAHTKSRASRRRAADRLFPGNYDTASAFSNLSNIRTYGELYGGLLSFVSGRMNDAVKQSMPYARFMDVYEPVCRAFNDSKLSFAFSSYANSEIIKRLNDSSMKTRDGIGYLVRIYKLIPAMSQ